MKAENCNESCSNYEYCKEEGIINMFVRGAICSDCNPKESEVDNEDTN